MKRYRSMDDLYEHNTMVETVVLMSRVNTLD